MIDKQPSSRICTPYLEGQIKITLIIFHTSHRHDISNTRFSTRRGAELQPMLRQCIIHS
jgi:hypothetical protein